MQNVFWNIYDLETRLGDIYGTRRDCTKKVFWNIYDFESKLSDIDGIIRGSILHLFFEIFMVLKQDLVILMAQGET